ncbi:MAG: polyphosphate kinase 1 [Peptococcaceae bacterium]|nr:polyphosphate kinase 1 [Peptococcaceae bacterium]
MSSETNKNPYVNRELSWLRFNERVLEEAEDERLPLFERMRFMSIFGSNLDEFFMVRVGGLSDAAALAPDEVDKKSKMTADQQLDMIYSEVREIIPRAEKCYVELMGRLRQHGIYQISPGNVTPYQEEMLERFFNEAVKPYLSPQVVDSHHPFPYLSNKEQYVCITFRGADKKPDIVVVPVMNTNFPRYFIFPDESGRGFCFVTSAVLVYYFADRLLLKGDIIDKFIFRLTRNGDLRVDEALYDEELDWRDQMEQLIKKRRHSSVIRMQLSKEIDPDILRFLLKKVKAKHKSVIITEELPLSLNFIYGLFGDLAPEFPTLNYEHLPSLMPACITPGDSIIRYLDRTESDIFLAYPYHSMKTFLDLLDEAAVDPTVTSINITLYRIASGSKVAQALAKAAENGKNVMALVELKARFDEEHNIIWSKRLEEAGCQVIYGFDQYKVHSKLCVITRNVGGEVKHIVQIGTGNYNEKTARQYTDFSLITTNKDIAAEAVNVFETLSLGQFVDHSHYLLVAPLQMKQRFLDLIDTEIEVAKAGEPARIVAKINGLSDKDIIDKLIEASQAGVKITMYIRGICCMRAGVLGLTENITIKSMVGRYLEHPRVFLFGYGDREHLYIGSADWMTRNLNYRVEVAVEILDKMVRSTIFEVLDILEKDNMLARVQQPDGTYKRLYPQEGEKKIDSQMEQYKMFKQLREETACLEDDVIAPYVERTVIQEENVPKKIAKSATVARAKSTQEKSSAAAQATEESSSEHRAPQTFMERLKYVLFGKF